MKNISVWFVWVKICLSCSPRGITYFHCMNLVWCHPFRDRYLGSIVILKCPNRGVMWEICIKFWSVLSSVDLHLNATKVALRSWVTSYDNFWFTNITRNQKKKKNPKRSSACKDAPPFLTCCVYYHQDVLKSCSVCSEALLKSVSQ